jgi:hypothetical protein
MAAIFPIIDPNETDFSKYSHLVGNNEFDADMNLVESFVRAYKQPENQWVQSSVFNYYISRIQNYWEVTREYAGSDKVYFDKLITQGTYKQTLSGKQLQKIQNKLESERKRGTQTKFSVEELDQFEQNILDYIEKLAADFNRSHVLDVIAITAAFKYIANIGCLTTPKQLVDIDFDDRKMPRKNREYPLPNTIGIFGFNTYLYAYTENIDLIGVPTKISFYDNTWGCPASFMSHDDFHTIRAGEINEFNKYVYYSILNDPNLTQSEKECHIINYWMGVHEYGFMRIFHEPIPIGGSTSPTINIWVAAINTLYKENGLAFLDLYKSIEGLTVTVDNINSFAEFEKGYALIDPRAEWDRIDKPLTPRMIQFFNGGKAKKKEKLEFYALLGIWYTAQYIYNLRAIWNSQRQSL